MFYHNKSKGKKGKPCGGHIFVDVSEFFSITAPVNISKNTLKITTINLNPSPKEV